MRSLELVFDPPTEARIREQWAALAEAGLPSLASHTAASNAPHATLAAGDDLELTESLRAAVAAEPLPGRVAFGSVLLFPHADRFVLAWGVTVSLELGALHRRVHGVLEGAVPTSLPGSWTPHVTLSRRLDAERVGRALPLLGEPFEGAIGGVRFWNGDEKELTPLG